MTDFVFTSPGVKFKEQDISLVTRNVGITTLGLVGETVKGPAFEPIFIQDAGQFGSRFGSQNTNRFSNSVLQYTLPYVANAYLQDSNQLWVTRVLGLSGYDAGTAWAITLSAGVDPSTTGATTSVTGTSSYTNNVYLGVPIYATGTTGTSFTGYTKINSTDFQGDSVSFTATTYSATTGSGTVYTETTTYTGTSYSEYENMVLAVVRSRGYVVDNVDAAPTTVFDATDLVVTANTTNVGSGDMFAQFNLYASDPTSTTDVPETYTVTLDPNSSDFISTVIGSTPNDKNTKIWVESVYPDLLKKLDANGLGYAINSTMINATSDVFTNYKTEFKTPETPWIVSQLKGSTVSRLFKFVSISDGDSANKEIKVSIENINPSTLEFDVNVRNYYDTDANPIILESFTRCSLIANSSSFVGVRIGTTDGIYDSQSNYIMVTLADNYPVDAFPAGFEGYYQSNFASSATSDGSTSGIAPLIMYKTDYSSTDNINKTYLGISETAYNGNGITGTGLNQNFWNFLGYQNGGTNNLDNFTKSYGFHLDSGATSYYIDGTDVIGYFNVGTGQLRTVNDTNDSTNPYYSIKTRKFTLTVAGGFDGWDVNRDVRSYGDLYAANAIYDGVAANITPTNDYQAWQTAISTFSNPDEVTINLFATPGINWSDQNSLVLNTIEMIEQARTDTLYIIDSPDITVPSMSIGSNSKPDIVAADDIVDLLKSANIDSSYVCTYFPYIQINDLQNNVNIFIPPTGEVAAAMAYTDNVAFPWYAPAGLTRGVTNARKSKYKLSQDARDILYGGRINPLYDYPNVGTAIMGQKTLQVKDTALNRINIRRLLLQVKVLISNIAIRLLFEQNDQTTRDQFTSTVNPILDTIKRERGLQRFDVKMDDSNNTPTTEDREELYGTIYLMPTKSVEFIGITFTITPSGASFNDLSL